ncbi:hypothetical protein A9Q99_09720 [Gammaproteobacteria bacterium 45_16_T64]|nr:hypothetical protein A9Q99_09720 [Gammaproteobacteria bacterium 45_16_T64]
MELISNFIELSLESAPFLVLGLVIAGLIKAWVPTESVAKHLGGKGLWPITKAALIGAPLPLCSCSVIPVTLGVHRSGASRGSTVSFLVSTPETGADSIAISYALLGPFMAIVRPISAISSAIFSGLLVSLTKEPEIEKVEEEVHHCCSSKKDTDEASADESSEINTQKVSPVSKTVDGLRYAFTDIFNNMVFWLAIGLGFAALVDTFIPTSFLQQWGSGLLAMVVMVLIGIPMYICATASTPMAAGFLLAGLSPGTVLVFLLAGPATNMATLAIVKKELGSGALAAYLIGIVVAAIGFGLLLDQIVMLWDINILAQVDGTHEMVNPWLQWLTGGLLALLTVKYSVSVMAKWTTVRT